MKNISLIILMTIMISGCDYKYKPKDGMAMCKEPKTISQTTLRADFPKISAPREIKKAAKIYNYKDGDIILVNELNKGIHVVNNQVRETPTNIKFLEIPGNVDMAIKDGYLYADSFTDLLVFDIRDINNIKLVNKREDVFDYDYYQAANALRKDANCYDRYNQTKNNFIVGY